MFTDNEIIVIYSFRIWDKIIGGSCKILVFVAVAMLLTLKRPMLSMKTISDVEQYLSQVGRNTVLHLQLPCESSLPHSSMCACCNSLNPPDLYYFMHAHVNECMEISTKI